VEYLRIPRDVLTLCTGKSTYARAGILVNITPFEPEWEGYPTIAIANTTRVPVKIYANEGLCQVLFFQSDEPCEVSYADRKGKYQAQTSIGLPRTRPE
jgi:dCTP deaminase